MIKPIVGCRNGVLSLRLVTDQLATMASSVMAISRFLISLANVSAQPFRRAVDGANISTFSSIHLQRLPHIVGEESLLRVTLEDLDVDVQLLLKLV